MNQCKTGILPLGPGPLIAVPMTDTDIDSIQSLAGAHLVEARVDMFSSLETDFVIRTITRCKEKFGLSVIATCRSQEEGGYRYIPDETRLHILESVSGITDALDVEINSPIAATIVPFSKARNTAIVLSYHDFEKTPPMDTLSGVYERGKSLGGDIVKIATMANTPDDLKVLTRFLLDHNCYDIAVIAMGDLAMSSRLFFPLIGSLITFASLNTKTAPGQISLKDAVRFLKK